MSGMFAAETDLVEARKVLETFFGQLQANKQAEAIDGLFGEDTVFYDDVESKFKLKLLLEKISTLAGDYRGYDIVVEKKITDRISYFFVLALYKKQPVEFSFKLVKPFDKWFLSGVNIDSELANVKAFKNQATGESLR